MLQADSWSSGRHRVEVRLTTNEPQVAFHEWLPLEIQTPPPKPAPEPAPPVKPEPVPVKPPPSLSIVSLPPMMITEPMAQPVVDWIASFPADTDDFSVAVMRNGDLLPESTAVIDRDARRVTCKIPMLVGENSIRISTSNSEKDERMTPPFVVEYRPMPRIDEVQVTLDQESFDAILEIHGRSPVSIQRVTVDDREYSSEEFESQFDATRFALKLPVMIDTDSQGSLAIAVYGSEATIPARATCEPLKLPRNFSFRTSLSFHLKSRA